MDEKIAKDFVIKRYPAFKLKLDEEGCVDGWHIFDDIESEVVVSVQVVDDKVVDYEFEELEDYTKLEAGIKVIEEKTDEQD